MERGFGIDASVPRDVAAEVASLVERSGYGSFWVNGSPPDAALDIIEAALERTELDVGVGVLPLPDISAEGLVAQVRSRDLPQNRLWLGVGSARRPGALDEVREAVHTLHEELDVTVVTGAVGPKMMTLAGEVADAVILTWSFAEEVEMSRGILRASSAAAGHETPDVISYVRCALLPGAERAVARRADVYDAIPHYRAVFARYGITAADTVVTGSTRAELLEGIEREEEVLDIGVIRAIPVENTVDSLAELVTACAP